MKEDRIKALGERFKPPVRERKKPKEAEKVRRTYYLDRALAEEVDKIYRRLNYELEGIAKSTFLETLLRFGLENLDVIEKSLREQTLRD
jgi:hypothetical protein